MLITLKTIWCADLIIKSNYHKPDAIDLEPTI